MYNKPLMKMLSCLLLPSLFTLVATFETRAEEYRYVDKAVMVDSLLARMDPKGVIIEPADYKRLEDGRYEVKLPQMAGIPDVVYLKTEFSWIRNEAAPSKPDALSEAGTFKLLNLAGSVEVKKDESGAWQKAQPGVSLVSGSLIRTGKDSRISVAVPGMQSVIGEENSEIRLTQEPQRAQVRTEVLLKQGTLFIKSRGFEGASHDFRIKTPKSVAAARGTEYLVSHRNGVSVTCLVEGGVDVSDAKGRLVSGLQIQKQGDLLFQAVPELEGRQYSEWLYNMVSVMGGLNDAGAEGRTFTGYLPVVLRSGTLKSAWEVGQSARIKW